LKFFVDVAGNESYIWGQFLMLDARYWMLDARCWMLDAGCWMLDTGCSMLDAGCWIHDKLGRNSIDLNRKDRAIRLRINLQFSASGGPGWGNNE
jgi:hypothetical protein